MSRWMIIEFTLAAAIAITMLGAAMILPGCVTYNSRMTERVLTPILGSDELPVMNPDTGGILYEESLFELSAEARAWFFARLEAGALNVKYSGEEDRFDLLFGTNATGLEAEVPLEDVGRGVGAAIGAALK